MKCAAGGSLACTPFYTADAALHPLFAPQNAIFMTFYAFSENAKSITCVLSTTGASSNPSRSTNSSDGGRGGRI